MIGQRSLGEKNMQGYLVSKARLGRIRVDQEFETYWVEGKNLGELGLKRTGEIIRQKNMQ